MRCAVLLLLLGGALSGARALPQSSSSALPSAANGKSGSPRDKVLAEPETIIDVTPSDDLAAKLSGAAEGDALELADGMYNLPATLAVDKKVTIRAKNARQAILDGGGKIRVLSISADAVVQDLVIKGGYANDDPGAGIYVTGGSPTITGNDIHENTCTGEYDPPDSCEGSGLYINTTTGTTISGGYIRDHTVCGGLFVASNAGPVTIAESITFIWNNKPYDCSGVTSPSCGLYPAVASCAAPPPPLPPPAPGANVTKFLEMYRVQEVTWVSELTNSDVANLEGEACYLTGLFVPTDIPRPVVAIYTLEAADPILDNDTSYLNCADENEHHEPIVPPRTCLDGGDRMRVGSTHCNSSDPLATCQCGDTLGIWYSLPAQGECINGGILGQDCYWRVTNISAIATWDCLTAANCTVHDCPYFTLQKAMDLCGNLPESRKLIAPACGPCDAMAPAPYSTCNELGRLDFDPYDCITCLEAPHGAQGWYAFSNGGQRVSWACHSSTVAPPDHAPFFKIDLNGTSGLNATDVCTRYYGDDGPHYSTFECVDHQCVQSPTGTSKPDCEAVCDTTLFACVDNQCVQSPTGLSKPDCETVCNPH